MENKRAEHYSNLNVTERSTEKGFSRIISKVTNRENAVNLQVTQTPELQAGQTC